MLLVSAVALIDHDGRVLLAQRPEDKPMAGLWEFPGGKIEPDETPETALIRELDEELGINTAATCLAPLSFTSTTVRIRHSGSISSVVAPLCLSALARPTAGDRGRHAEMGAATTIARLPHARS